MGTRLHLPSYPSAEVGGLQTAFRQNPGGGEILGFEAFQFDFNDLTADAPPPNGSIPTKFGVAPLVSIVMKQQSKYLTGGPWNRTLNFPQPGETGFENSTGWAFDARDYGNGVDLPFEGWKCQFYWGCYQTGGQDMRWGQFNMYAGTMTDLDVSNPGAGYRCLLSVGTTNVRHYNRHLIDNVQIHLSDLQPAGASQTNYFVWQEIVADYTNRTIQSTIHDLQQAGETTSGVISISDVETFPLVAYRYFGFHSGADANNCGVKLHHGWFGKLSDDFPAHLSLTT